MKYSVVFTLGLLLSGSYASAGTITTWTFQGVTFADGVNGPDGGTLSGSFQFDSTIGVFSNVNIVTTASTSGDATGAPLGAFTFTTAEVSPASDYQVLELCSPVSVCGFASGDELLTLYFSNNAGLSGPGLNGTSPVPIDYSNSFQSQGVNLRNPATGTLVATPEPASFTLAMIGCLGVLLLRLIKTLIV